MKAYPIAETRFVEGLEFIDETHLMMSSGSYGNSHLDILDIETDPMETIKSVQISDIYFGEGVTYVPETGETIMLTYRKRKAFRFNQDLELIEELTIPSMIKEGWGMTHIDGDLLVSDGSQMLYYVDPETFEITSSIAVTDNGRPLTRINELEHVNGKIYANVFQLDTLLEINMDGTVAQKYDLSDLLKQEKQYLRDHGLNWSSYDHANNVLNGIAYHEWTDTFFVTGKNWHFIYQIRLN